MGKIRAIGTLIKTDKEGYLLREAGLRKISVPWKKCVEELKKEYISHFKKNLHSIYVRGSVAKGTAVKKVSDLDSFVVIHRNQESVSWIREIRKKLESKYPFITKIEISIFLIKQTKRKYRDYNRRFQMKVQSVCIYGKDLSKDFEKFKPGKYMAKRQNNYLMKKEIGDVRRLLKKSNPKKTGMLCAWIMKRILRTGFLLVLEREKTFTKDLYPSYFLFSKHYPEKEPDMKKCLEYAVFPIQNKKEILKILDNLGMFIVTEAKGKLKK